MPVPPLDLVGDEKLSPPHPKFVIGEGASDSHVEATRVSYHSRTASGTTSFQESPPVTPRSLTFNTHRNSFTALNSFFPNDHNSGTTHNLYPFPDAGRDNSTNGTAPPSGATSVAASAADLTSRQRNTSSVYGSRPNTGNATHRPSTARSREAFASPKTRPLTMYSVVQPSIAKIERERPKSTMLVEAANLQKPWLKERDPYQRISYFITYGVMFLGLAAGAARCFFGYKDALLLPGNLCPVLDESFDSDAGLFGDNGKFLQEVDMSGFGNGQFDMTTASANNSYVKNGYLYITPTLTSDNIGVSAVEDGFVYNITGCTFNVTQGFSYTSATNAPINSSAIGADQAFDLAAYTKACSAVSNATTGQIINPVQSARLSTRKTASIKYGKVEVRAKIPTGDWLWPAIWMLPVDNTYGPWPISGEIDIMEARGNGPKYPKQGTNYVRGSLNWGPLTWLNAVSKTFGWWWMRRGSFDEGFHVYSLEWDKDFMRMYVDSRLHHLLDLRINEPFFERGDFPTVVQNGSQAIILTNPWVNGTKSAPFDQSFYLILDLAVGGTNGWFPDGAGDKPWLDGSTTPMLDFWRNRNAWLPTWSTSNAEARSFVIDHVKMWQQC